MLDTIAASPLGRRYRAPRMDLWYYFLHRGLELLKPGGRLSYIVGAYWTSGSGARQVIRALRESAEVEEIFLLGRLRVFRRVAGRHLILRVRKGTGTDPTTVKLARPTPGPTPSPTSGASCRSPPTSRAPGSFLSPIASTSSRPAKASWPSGRAWPRSAASAGSARESPRTRRPSTATVNRRHGGRWTAGEGVFALTPAGGPAPAACRKTKPDCCGPITTWATWAATTWPNSPRCG